MEYGEEDNIDTVIIRNYITPDIQGRYCLVIEYIIPENIN